jgi:hypothetical protein
MQRSLNGGGGSYRGSAKQLASSSTTPSAIRVRKSKRSPSLQPLNDAAGAVLGGRADGREGGMVDGGNGSSAVVAGGAGEGGRTEWAGAGVEGEEEGELSVKDELENKSAYMRQVLAERTLLPLTRFLLPLN